jgi:glycosyltransferase involved in cell wall biosynthesis
MHVESIPQAPLRVLAIQTTPAMSSEVSVFHTLLSASELRPEAPPLEVLLIQGADRERANGTQSAEAFSKLPSVEVHPVNVGGLGREGMSKARRAAKVFDVASLYGQWGRVAEGAEKFQPDLIYSSQQRWDQRLAVALARRAGIPRVVHLHYTVGPWLGRGAVDALRSAHAVVAVSDFIRDDAIRSGVRPERAHVLYNAIQRSERPRGSGRTWARVRLRRELAIPDDTLIVGMVARISASKGQTELVEAMLPVLRRHDEVHLVLAGAEYPSNSGVAKRLEDMATGERMGSRIHLLGQRPDVPQLLDAFDIFAHPTHAEPCALAVLEAISHGLPVVAWNEGGTRELVIDSESGVLVDTGDILGLGAALETLLLDPERRDAMGRSAHRLSRTAFDPVVASRRFADLLGKSAAAG